MLELCIVIEVSRAQKISVEKPEKMFQENMNCLREMLTQK